VASSKWSIEKLNGSVCRVHFGSAPLWAYITSDWHWDSLKCDRDALQGDLALAKKLNAPVFAFGDIFDAMGGKYDPRGSKDELRPELLAGNYFDEAIEQCASWLKPYASVISFISPGNHETAIRKRQETCMTTRLVERLKQSGSPVQQGGYSGWIMFHSRPSGRKSATHRMWYHHGYGGGGPVTRGVIDFSRFLVDVDADSIVAGHVHQRTLIEATRQRVSDHGKVRVQPIYLARSASYKNECLTDGWSVEKGLSSRPLGGWWVRFKFSQSHGTDSVRASFHDKPYTNGEKHEDS
jgi:hypothetical protein